jgi:hypothetical protein
MKYKPLEVDDASPCMKCGSVQCAFCSDDILSAIKGFKKEYTLTLYDDTHKHIIPIFPNTMFEMLDKWFPCFKGGK